MMAHTTEFPHIETERLVLRQISLEDTEAIVRHFSDGEMLKYMNFGPIGSIEEAQRVIRWGKTIFENGSGILWGIVERESGTFSGTLNYVKKEEEDGSSHRAEITYDLARAQWGKGYMVEAIKATLPYVFEEMNIVRVETTVHWENIRSARTLRSVGFTMEGFLRKYGCWRCGLIDVLMFSILKEDWERQRGTVE